MPKLKDIDKVLIIGSGPIVIGQACEFDYSGTQACKALRKLGYKIVLVNSNPATIMTDPETADVTYIEPLNVERLEQIIAKERPDALLPNLGGQSGLNLCSELAKAGVLDKYNVKATFFMTGGWVDSYPDMVKEICSRGHDLGNHSHNHKQMSKLSASEQKDEIMYVTDKVKELTGYDVFLFRPPYGDYNSTLINTVYGCNHYPIQWNVDSLDWRDYGVENIIKTVTNHKALGNGSIILMHNGAKYTAKALGTVIETLQSQGYTFIPISEMIIRDNFHMDGTGRQIAD